MHDIDGPFWIEGFWKPIQIILNRFTPSEIEIGVDGSDLVGLIRRSNIRRILLGRPKSFPVIHLFIVFCPEWSWGDKGVSDEFVSIFESMTSLIEIVNSFLKFSKEIRITQIPVSRYENNLSRRGGHQQPFKEGWKKLVNKGSLIWNHIFVSFCWRERGEEVTPYDNDF